MLQSLTGIDMLLLLVIGGFIIWEIIGLLTARGKILLEGKIYGRVISMGLFALLVALAVWRQWEYISSSWILFVGIVISFALFMLMKAGFGEKGFYINGRFVPFEKIRYYDIERETEEGFCLRINAGYKEYTINYTTQQRELVMAYLIKGKVPDMKTAINSGKV